MWISTLDKNIQSVDDLHFQTHFFTNTVKMDFFVKKWPCHGTQFLFSTIFDRLKIHSPAVNRKSLLQRKNKFVMEKIYKFTLAATLVLLVNLHGQVAFSQHFNFVGGSLTGPVWTLYVTEATLNGSNLEPGDEIAVFDGTLMVGAFVLTQTCTPENQFENPLAAYKILMSGAQGYVPGHTATFKCWDASLGVEVAQCQTTFDNPYGDAWTQAVFPANADDYSLPHFHFTWTPTGTIAGLVTISGTSQPIAGGTNSSGFSGLPGGFRYYYGPFDFISNHGYWWSSTQSSTTDAWTWSLTDYGVFVFRDFSLKEYGFSVRCLKD